MKKSVLNIFLFFVILSFSSCGYNGGVERDEKVKAAWGQVENVYQRRADLIPNLVETVKGYAGHESNVLIKITEARASATKINVDANNLTPENIAKFQQTQDNLTAVVAGGMRFINENYPDLKANENFLSLQAQLEGTENRIAVERKKFNEAVQDYNTFGKQIPNNLFSGMWNYSPKGYFTAAPGADKAPSVKF